MRYQEHLEMTSIYAEVSKVERHFLEHWHFYLDECGGESSISDLTLRQVRGLKRDLRTELEDRDLIVPEDWEADRGE